MPEIIRTFQCRVGDSAALDAMGGMMGHLARRLYARMAAGDADVNAVKRKFIAEHGITARHFNALRIQVEGMIDGVRALLKTHVEETEARLKSLDAKIKKLQRKVDDPARKKTKAVAKPTDRVKAKSELHQRKRRRDILAHRAVVLRERLAKPEPGVCFGSRKLFRAQFSEDANSYDDHAMWRADWRDARSDNILCVGSKDETAGNQTCQAQITSDGSISLKLRLPDALGIVHGKYQRIEGLRFGYGHAQVSAALAACARKQGAAVTWRFVRDAKGWRAFVSVNEAFAVICGDIGNGAIGVDVNAGHLAVAVADTHGNPISFRRMATPIVGASAERRKAIYGDAAKVIVDMALARRVPIILEALDFGKKKSELETGSNPRRARMLSSLAYRQIGAMIRSRAVRLGVHVIERNPAYTSLIGDATFSERHGVSVHLSAALAIARRGMGLSERLPRQPSLALGGGARVTLVPPARMGRRHVWASWARLSRSRKAALAGRSGSASRRSSTARLQGPAVERSLEQDRLFLEQLLNSGSAGETPATKPSPALLGRRTDTKVASG